MARRRKTVKPEEPTSPASDVENEMRKIAEEAEARRVMYEQQAHEKPPESVPEDNVADAAAQKLIRTMAEIQGVKEKPPKDPPPEPPVDPKMAERCIVAFGISPDIVAKAVGVREAEFTKRDLEPQENAAKVVTSTGRKLYYMPSVKARKPSANTCFWCQKKLDAFMCLGLSLRQGQPPYFRLCPSCAHGILHEKKNPIMFLDMMDERVAEERPVVRAMQRDGKLGVKRD